MQSDSDLNAPLKEGAPTGAKSGVSPVPQQLIIEPRSGVLMRVITFIGSFGVVCCLLIIGIQFAVILGQYVAYRQYFDTTENIQERYHSLERYAGQKVAIINVNGVIMEGDGFVKRQIDRVARDKSVKAIVLRINSPGGTVSGSDYIFHHLKKLKKEKKIPMVVSMGGMAASGGYYVAMAVGETENSIFAEPTTTTGSIGVIIPHYDLSGLLARYDVKNDSISSHPRKQMLSMTRPMDPEDRKILQAYVDESFGQFKEIVKEGRPQFRNDEAGLTELATGEIFTANQALEHGLVDQIGFVEDAIERVLELADLDKEKVRVVSYERTALQQVMRSRGDPSASFDLATVLELSTPRAYYLATWLPGVVTSREQ